MGMNQRKFGYCIHLKPSITTRFVAGNERDTSGELRGMQVKKCWKSLSLMVAKDHIGTRAEILTELYPTKRRCESNQSSSLRTTSFPQWQALSAHYSVTMDRGHKLPNSTSHHGSTLAAKTAERNSRTYSITTYIPPELIGEIIDHLKDDKDALLYIQEIGLHWPTYYNNSAPDLLPRFTTFLLSLTNLTSLSLSAINLRDASHLHTVICPLHRLTSLALKNVFFHSVSSESHTVPDYQTSVESSPKIEAISMYGTSFHASIVDLIIHRQDLRTVYVNSLRKLCIKYPPGEYLSSICTFLRATAGSLRRLDLYIRRSLYTPGLLSSWPAQLDRLPLTMQTLHIVINYDERWDWHVKVLSWLLDSLSGPDGAVRLETMMLTIILPYDDTGSNDYLQNEDWGAQWTSLDKTLAHLTSSTFRRLKVTFRPYVGDCSPWRGPYCKIWMEGRLPLLHEKRFLQVDTVEYTGDFH
ncbi:hypothetical protein EDD18DRAFT_1405332 [Armillaria luteobubalina]|uniref:Uncharacterized protein n=1 Tax=Armillaria luteobubalina TaxID=153913 RepID=A0AA39UKX0_9AGAR|nr:hypothetical protein EDD18DRAFT_1405332 [Armillaria luteobubalina]